MKEGDKVTVIDEELSGTVICIQKGWVEVESEDGFVYRYRKEQLYCQDGEYGIEFYPGSFQFPDQAESSNDKEFKKSEYPTLNFKGAKPEFDLHLEHLLPDRQPNQKDALQIQLNYARKVINRAVELRVRNLVFIHGMGQGILREALRNMLTEEYPNIEYMDGNYQKYGQGATEVNIYGLGSR